MHLGETKTYAELHDAYERDGRGFVVTETWQEGRGDMLIGNYDTTAFYVKNGNEVVQVWTCWSRSEASDERAEWEDVVSTEVWYHPNGPALRNDDEFELVMYEGEA